MASLDWMDLQEQFLQGVGYHYVTLLPMLPTDLLLIASALFPIYIGAHASLSRPSSAAKSSKRKKQHGGFHKLLEDDYKMEALMPSDAIMMPFLAGLTLTGLYFLMKWVQDPAVLNKILNWYFALFGVFSLAQMLSDSLGTIHSYIFPHAYASDGQIWTVFEKERKVKRLRNHRQDWEGRGCPLPGPLSTFPWPALEKRVMWIIREMPSHKFSVKVFIRSIIQVDVKIGPHSIAAFVLALCVELYFNLVDKPWWLTNLLGFSFAYASLQLISPSTAWTGTLILGALLLYDIYFVFFTVLMITVAQGVDIPAKLLFPAPGRLGSDPTKQAMSMLGLGDVILPGIVMGFALRFDLYLFYLRKQKPMEKPSDQDQRADTTAESNTASQVKKLKAKWHPAAGNWGERYWTRDAEEQVPKDVQAGIFPKTYFHATMIGYVIGMLVTVGVLQFSRHAQPALLYLVPGILGTLWGTAFIKGDIQTLWAFNELDESNEKSKASSNTDEGDSKSKTSLVEWITAFFSSEESPKDSSGTKTNGQATNGDIDNSPRHDADDESSETARAKANGTAQVTEPFVKQGFTHDKGELIYFSVHLMPAPSVDPPVKKDVEQNLASEMRHQAQKAAKMSPEDGLTENTDAELEDMEPVGDEEIRSLVKQRQVSRTDRLGRAS